MFHISTWNNYGFYFWNKVTELFQSIILVPYFIILTYVIVSYVVCYVITICIPLKFDYNFIITCNFRDSV